MAKKNKEIIIPTDFEPVKYIEKLDSSPEYSLEVDPEDKYNMSDEQKEFIKNYVQLKNLPLAARLAGIQPEVAECYFMSYSAQQEIRRINKAFCQRQFATKLMTVDEIGGYLSSLITGENVPLGDQLKTNDKLRVIQMLMDLHSSKAQFINEPSSLNEVDLENTVKELSIDTIKQLLNTSNAQKETNKKNKKKAVDEIKRNRKLTLEETAYLESLPYQELLKLVDDANKK